MIVIDMEIPKNCKECRFFDGEDMCYVDGTYALNPSRISVCPSWCPIKCDIEDIKAEIKAIQVAEIQIYGKESWNFTGKCLDAIDERIGGDTDAE